jgi:hypothetical protein
MVQVWFFTPGSQFRSDLFFFLFSKDFVVNADMFYKMHSDWDIRLPYDINAVNFDVVLFDLQNTLLHTS